MGRIVGIDFGLARLGVALSDESKMLATPLITMTAEKSGAKTVAKLLMQIETDRTARGYTVEEIVIGLPLMMSGRTGLLSDEVQHFAELLRASTPIPIILWDERLTTIQAERSMRESGMSQKKRKARVDLVSAVIILQNYLDSKSLPR